MDTTGCYGYYESKFEILKEQRKLSDYRLDETLKNNNKLRAKLRGSMRAFDNLSIQKRRITDNLQEKTSQFPPGVELMMKDLVDETLAENQKLTNQIAGRN